MPTSPRGTVHAEHVWKRFRADRTLPLFQEQVKLVGKWLKGQTPRLPLGAARRQPPRRAGQDLRDHRRQRVGQVDTAQDDLPDDVPLGGHADLGGTDRGSARGAQRHPSRPLGPPERLPLRQHPGADPSRDLGTLRRHRGLRRDRRRHRPPGQVLLDRHGHPVGIRHRRLPRARHPARGRGPGRRRRPLPAEVPGAHQPGGRQRHHAVLRLPRPPDRRGGVRPGHVAGRQLRPSRRPGPRRREPVPRLGRGTGVDDRRPTTRGCASSRWRSPEPDGGQVCSGEEVQPPYRGGVRRGHVRGLPHRRLPGHRHAGVRAPLRQLLPRGPVRAALPDAQPAAAQGPLFALGGDARAARQRADGQPALAATDLVRGVRSHPHQGARRASWCCPRCTCPPTGSCPDLRTPTPVSTASPPSSSRTSDPAWPVPRCGRCSTWRASPRIGWWWSSTARVASTTPSSRRPSAWCGCPRTSGLRVGSATGCSRPSPTPGPRWAYLCEDDMVLLHLPDPPRGGPGGAGRDGAASGRGGGGGGLRPRVRGPLGPHRERGAPPGPARGARPRRRLDLGGHVGVAGGRRRRRAARPRPVLRVRGLRLLLPGARRRASRCSST